MYRVEFAKIFFLGHMVIFACHHDLQLSSFSTENTLKFVDTTTNGTVYESLAKRDDCLNLEQLSLTLE